jgi:hypothetical protein
MTEAEQIMKRCQVGTRNYDDANNLHADCYRVIGKLLKTVAELESQEPVAWKLMPRDATDAMLKAMDKCSTEGYDERLYAGHAASVYMAAWDAYPDINQKKGEHMNAVNATPHSELIAELLNPNNPKNEREHAAVREIERLRETQQAVIAGALFDFMGWLTSRKERIVLSSADNASPAVDAIRDFAKMRGLSLDDAKVQNWHTHPPQRTEPVDYEKLAALGWQAIECGICGGGAMGYPQRTWVGLTDEEENEYNYLGPDMHWVIQEIAAKLKEKNT